MSIKIKYIKQFFLFSACIFFAALNYFTYVKADTAASTDSICNKSLDSDCDGLTDTEEKLYNTNINNADSDGDGYSDGVEVKSGYDPTKPAPGDRISTNDSGATVTSSSSQTTANSLTDSFSEDLESFIDSKEGDSISNSDINNFIEEKFEVEAGEPITLDSLPEFDISTLKIIDQTYPTLNTEQKEDQIKEDMEKYYIQVAYLLLSNSPKTLLTASDFSSFYDDFVSNLSSLSTGTSNNDYFLELGGRLETFLIQLSDVEVPQTFVDSHVKIIRMAKAVLSLKDTFSSSESDPLMKMVLISKVQGISELLIDFFQNDFSDFNKNLGL